MSSPEKLFIFFLARLEDLGVAAKRRPIVTKVVCSCLFSLFLMALFDFVEHPPAFVAHPVHPIIRFGVPLMMGFFVPELLLRGFLPALYYIRRGIHLNPAMSTADSPLASGRDSVEPTATVFISYSHDSEDHRNWVERLARQLESSRIRVLLDIWDCRPGMDLCAFMEKSIRQSDKVIAVCTPTYVAKANEGWGGVAYEKLILSAEMATNIDTERIIPIVRAKTASALPQFLGNRLYVDFTDDHRFEEALKHLWDAIQNRSRRHK
jgi:TIR domain-containing protein